MDDCHVLGKIGGSGIRKRGRSRGIGDDSGVSAIQYHERTFLCGAVDAVVVRKLSEREPVTPIHLLMVDKDSEVLLDLLVHSVCLSVGLGMEGRGSVWSDVEHLIEFLHELRDELGSPVRDDHLGHSVLCIYMIPKDPGPAFG